MPDPITFHDARASIEVADVATALAFFTDVVGLDVEATMGEPLTFALVRGGGVALGLAGVDAPAELAIAPVFVTLSPLDALAERLAAAGVALESEPTTRPWGLRDLVVRCPGGGPLVAFGEQVAP